MGIVMGTGGCVAGRAIHPCPLSTGPTSRNHRSRRSAGPVQTHRQALMVRREWRTTPVTCLPRAGAGLPRKVRRLGPGWARRPRMRGWTLSLHRAFRGSSRGRLGVRGRLPPLVAAVVQVPVDPAAAPVAAGGLKREPRDSGLLAPPGAATAAPLRQTVRCSRTLSHWGQAYCSGPPPPSAYPPVFPPPQPKGTWIAARDARRWREGRRPDQWWRERRRGRER